MRICLYTATAYPQRGGQELVLDSLAREFLRLRHEVVILSPQGRDAPEPNDSELPYRVIRHPRYLSGRYLVDWYRWFLLRLFRSWPFDVLHCHGVYPPGYLGVKCRRALGVPVVITNHDGNLADGTSRYFKKAGVYRRHVKTLAEADALVAISRFSYEGYRRLNPNGVSIVSIPNGVSAEFAEPAMRPTGLDPDILPREYVLFLGRLKHRKGVDLLLQAFARAARNGSLLVVAGEGQERPKLVQLSRELGVEERVRFLGWVTGTTKRYLLQNTLCTVVPSRWSEAFGLVALESYAAGRPVIATSIPGLRELVQDGRTGVLVEEECSRSLAGAIERMIECPDWTDRLGKEGRLVAQDYGWPEIALQHLNLYERLLGEKKPPAALLQN